MTKINRRRQINLKEIAASGESFEFTQASGELSSILEDLIGKNDFIINMTILPLGNSYNISGSIKTDQNLICSRCAIDFVQPLNIKIKEILYVQKQVLDRKGKSGRANHISDYSEDALHCTYLEDDFLDVGEFVHEIIAINEPLHPTAKPDCDDSCENLLNAYKSGWLEKIDPQAESKKETHNPFEALKDFKLKR